MAVQITILTLMMLLSCIVIIPISLHTWEKVILIHTIKKELLNDIRNRNYSSVIRQFPSDPKIINKIFESLGINCDEYYANDETYLEINE